MCQLLHKKTSSKSRFKEEQGRESCWTSDENKWMFTQLPPSTLEDTQPGRLGNSSTLPPDTEAHIYVHVDLHQYITMERHTSYETLMLSNKSNTNLISFSPSASITCRICFGVIGASE